MTIPPEVWLRGRVDGVCPLLQPAAYAILQVGEDVLPIVADLTPEQLWAPPVSGPGACHYGIARRWFQPAREPARRGRHSRHLRLPL